MKAESQGLAPAQLHRCRIVLGVFILGLVLSGLTAFPLSYELDWLAALRGLAPDSTPAQTLHGFDRWIVTVRNGLREVYAHHAWMAYGTDWLAFAHLVLAVFFLGPLMDPVRNVWVLKAGLVACVGVPVLALTCGPLRGIPLGWRLIDCSFGVFGAIPLCYCLRLVQRRGE